MSLRHGDSPETGLLPNSLWRTEACKPPVTEPGSRSFHHVESWEDCNPDQQLECNLTRDLRPEPSRFHPTKPSTFLTLGNYKIINVSCLKLLSLGGICAIGTSTYYRQLEKWQKLQIVQVIVYHANKTMIYYDFLLILYTLETVPNCIQIHFMKNGCKKNVLSRFLGGKSRVNISFYLTFLKFKAPLDCGTIWWRCPVCPSRLQQSRKEHISNTLLPYSS